LTIGKTANNIGYTSAKLLNMLANIDTYNISTEDELWVAEAIIHINKSNQFDKAGEARDADREYHLALQAMSKLPTDLANYLYDNLT
jgi:hypothetical protein